MSDNGQMIFTKAGLAKIESATKAGLSLEITELALGDGDGSDGYDVRDVDGVPLESAKNMTALKGEKWRGSLNAGSDANPYQLNLRAVIEPSSVEFYVREVGVYADDVLVAVWSEKGGNIGYRSSGAELVFDFVLVWSDLPSGALTVVFDENTAVEGVRVKVEKVADLVDEMQITKKRVFAHHEGEILAHAIHPKVAEDLPEDLNPPLTINETGFDPDMMESTLTKKYLVCYFFTNERCEFVTQQRLDNHDALKNIKDIFDNSERAYESIAYDANGLPIESFTADWVFSSKQNYAEQTDGTFSSDDGVWGISKGGLDGNFGDKSDNNFEKPDGYYYGNLDDSDDSLETTYQKGSVRIDSNKASVIVVIADNHLAINTAREDVQGVVRLASESEVKEGLSDSFAITPKTLKTLTATSTRSGLVELATNSETQTGTSANLAVTPAGLASALAGFGSANTPKGIIVMWSGNTAPSGWALCDGENGTPDLRGKFILGGRNFNEIGSTGGTSSHVHEVSVEVEGHTLTVDEIPPHSHYHYDNSSGARRTTYMLSRGNEQMGQTESSETGGGQAHSHRATVTEKSKGHLPPYYTLAYIMKL